MNDVLIGLLSCHKNVARREAQRQTWLPELQGADYRFFCGQPEIANEPDTVALDCPDGYGSLVMKTLSIVRWALGHDYKFLFHADDDTFIRPALLLASGFERFDYVGIQQKLTQYHPDCFAPGGPGYWLSRKAMIELIEFSENTDLLPESVRPRYKPQPDMRAISRQGNDQYVGFAMYWRQVAATTDPRYFQNYADAAPTMPSDRITCHTTSTSDMYRIHSQLKGLRA